MSEAIDFSLFEEAETALCEEELLPRSVAEWQPSVPSIGDNLYQKALQLAEQGKLSDAINTFSEAERHYLFVLTDAHRVRHSGQPYDVYRFFQIGFAYYRTHREVGKVYAQNGDYFSAETALKMADYHLGMIKHDFDAFLHEVGPSLPPHNQLAAEALYGQVAPEYAMSRAYSACLQSAEVCQDGSLVDMHNSQLRRTYFFCMEARDIFRTFLNPNDSRMVATALQNAVLGSFLARLSMELPTAPTSAEEDLQLFLADAIRLGGADTSFSNVLVDIARWHGFATTNPFSSGRRRLLQTTCQGYFPLPSAVPWPFDTD